MSEILEKNLQYIKTYNPDLAKKISDVREYTKTFEINTNLVGEYNLLIDGIPVHSLTGAEQEAKDIFSEAKNLNYSSIHVILGLGLGYLCDVFSQNTFGYTVVFEPDIETYRYVLEIVDFSESFAKNRTFFVSNIGELKNLFGDILRYKSKLSIVSLDYYSSNRQDVYGPANSQISTLYEVYSHNYSFQVKNVYKFLQSGFGALDKKLSAPLITDYKDIFKGKPAIIASAGPSLSKNIEIIKKNRDKFVVFCVSTSLKTLLDNDIVPDFLSVIDKTDTTIHYAFPQTKDIILLCEPFTHEGVLKQNFKNVLLSCSNEMDVSRWFLEIKGRQDSYFESKGTVSYQALYSAYTFGCNPIILIGQDLAYADGDCYARGSQFDGLKCNFDEKLKKFVVSPVDFEKFKQVYVCDENCNDEQKEKIAVKFLEHTNENLKTVQGQNGEKLPTSSVYKLFINYISSFGERYGDKVKLFNCSKGGAQIDYFENADIGSVINKYACSDINKEQCLQKLCESSSVDIPAIVSRLKSDLKELNSLSETIKPGAGYMEKFDKEMSLKKQFTQQAQTSLEAAMNLYIRILKKHFVNSKLATIIATKQISELSVLIRDYQNNPDENCIKRTAKVATEFYTAVPNQIKEIKSELANVISKLEK